ncbi:MAG: SMC-Scp complex subunit ScpB, partial [Phycisphaerae bacterium]
MAPNDADTIAEGLAADGVAPVEKNDGPEVDSAGDSGEVPPAGGDLEITPEAIIEAVLFSTDDPLPAAKIAQILGFGNARVVKKHISVLNERYEQAGTAFRIEEVAGGFQMLSQPTFHRWISKLQSVRRENKLTRAGLETLAIVAYKQPVMRVDIEAVRGVAVGDILNRLRENGLVKIVGRAEVIGRPMLYGTTKKFLQVFGLGSLDDLPEVEALPKPPETAAEKPS